MRYITYLTALLVTFAVGVLFHLVLVRNSEPEMMTVSELQHDEWHKLFEAAAMTQDDWIRADVFGRFQCMGSDHSLTTRLYMTGTQMSCATSVGRMTPWSSPTRGDDMFQFILETHSAWSRSHMDFIESVADSKTRRDARATRDHLTFITTNVRSS